MVQSLWEEKIKAGFGRQTYPSLILNSMLTTLHPFKKEFNPLEMFRENLPEKPYCTDELGSLFIRPKEQAVSRRYIQHNSPFDLCWFVYDVDRPTAHFDWYERGAPAPNITAMNLENGHSHLFYGLEIPVIKCEFNPKVHKKPIRFAGAVDVALTKKLEADPGYAGLICKNPLHQKWDVQVWQTYPYDLSWLSDYLDLEPYYDARKPLPPIGLGRNCTLFYFTSRWAYKQIRKPGAFFNEEFFIYEVTQYAAERNAEFPAPLPLTEVKATGKSVGKWTWAHMSPEGFDEWGDRRRTKSIKVRKAKSQERAEEIRAYKYANPEASYRDISGKLGYGLRTIHKALRRQ